MSEMRLRHRKPINSYAGQVNEHSNVKIHEFEESNDQDFARNSLQLKKPKFLKAKSPLDQSKRYAEILCEFVQAVNRGRNENILDYRDHCFRFKSTNEGKGTEEKKEEENRKKELLKIIKDDGYVKNVEVVSKEEEKIAKEEFLNKTILPNKKIKKDQPVLHENAKNPITLTSASKPTPNISIETKNSTPASVPPPAIQPTNLDKPKPSSIPSQGMTFIPQIAPMASLQQIQQYQQMQQMFQNPLYGMNPAMYSMFPYQMMNYQYYMEQLKQNPYAMQGMMGMLPSGMNSNYIPFSKLPFQTSSIPEPKKEEKQEEKQQPPVQEKKEEKQIVRNEEAVLKPEAFGLSGNQPIDFKKKSCYHVAISYNIHFGRMKEKGLFANFNSQENLEKLDPTFPAKKIRQRKVSDTVANINDNTSV